MKDFNILICDCRRIKRYVISVFACQNHGQWPMFWATSKRSLIWLRHPFIVFVSSVLLCYVCCLRILCYSFFPVLCVRSAVLTFCLCSIIFFYSQYLLCFLLSRLCLDLTILYSFFCGFDNLCTQSILPASITTATSLES